MWGRGGDDMGLVLRICLICVAFVYGCILVCICI